MRICNERHVDEDAEHREQRGFNGGLLNFLTDDWSFLVHAERFVTELRVREGGLKGLENLVRSCGLICLARITSRHLQGVHPGADVALIRHEHFARPLAVVAALRTSHAGLMLRIDFQHYFSPPGNLNTQDVRAADEDSVGIAN